MAPYKVGMNTYMHIHTCIHAYVSVQRQRRNLTLTPFVLTLNT